MSSLSDLALVFGGVFLVSFVLARVVTSAHRRAKPGLVLVPNAKLKLLTPSGAYRCHVESFGADGLKVSCPLHRDSYVPLRVGESVVVQTPQNGSLVTFRSEVLERSRDEHTLVLARPASFRRTERRCEPRLRTVHGQVAELNGGKATMVDVSAWGARVLTSEPVQPGEAVELVLPNGIGAVRGWVLDESAAAIGIRLGRDVRIRFEDPLSGLVLQKGWHSRLRAQ